MAGVVSVRPTTAERAGADGRPISEWVVRPRQVGALLALRWRLEWRRYRRSVTAAIGLGAMVTGVVLFSIISGFLTGLGYTHLPPRSAAQLLFATLGLLYITWAALPVLQYSLNEGLDLTKLATYPVTRAERMFSLILGTFFDPSTLIILGLCAAVFVGWRGDVIATGITIVAVALLYVHVIGISQLTLGVLVGLLRTRRYRDLSIVIFAMMSVACSLSGQFLSTALRQVGGIAFLGRIDVGRYVQWLPPGMAARAIILAHTGQPLQALIWLAALAALTPALVVIWAWTLDRSVTTAEIGGAPAPMRRRTPSIPLNPSARVRAALGLDSAGATSAQRRWRPSFLSPASMAIAVKDLRYAWRDPQIKASLLSSLVLLFVVFAPDVLRSGGSSDYFSQRLAGYQPLLAPLPALLIVLTLSLNALGLERQGLQTLFLTPARPRDILWGKNLAVGIIAFAAQVSLIIAVAIVSSDWSTVPLALIEGAAATLTLLGVGNITSILLPLRVRGLHAGANNISSENGCLRSVISLVALWGTLFALLPVYILLLAPALIDHREFLLFSAPLALLYGLALYQIATLLIAPRLLKRGPELLALITRDV